MNQFAKTGQWEMSVFFRKKDCAHCVQRRKRRLLLSLISRRIHDSCAPQAASNNFNKQPPNERKKLDLKPTFGSRDGAPPCPNPTVTRSVYLQAILCASNDGHLHVYVLSRQRRPSPSLGANLASTRQIFISLARSSSLRPTLAVKLSSFILVVLWRCAPLFPIFRFRDRALTIIPSAVTSRAIIRALPQEDDIDCRQLPDESWLRDFTRWRESSMRLEFVLALGSLSAVFGKDDFLSLSVPMSRTESS